MVSTSISAERSVRFSVHVLFKASWIETWENVWLEDPITSRVGTDRIPLYVFTMYHTCMFPWDARFRSFVGPFQKERKAQSFSRQQLIIYIYSNTSTKNLPLTARDLGIEVKDKTTLSIINQVCTKSFEALQQLLQKSQLLPSRPAILSLQTKYLGQTAAWRSKQKNNSKLLLCEIPRTFCNFDQFWINIRRPVHAQTQLA